MFPHLTNNLKYQLEVVTPAVYGASIVEELAAVPLTGTQSSKLIKRTYIYGRIYIYKRLIYYEYFYNFQNMVLWKLL